jgi:hypothetical protein
MHRYTKQEATPFQTVGLFGFSRSIVLAIHLDIVYV